MAGGPRRRRSPRFPALRGASTRLREADLTAAPVLLSAANPPSHHSQCTQATVATELAFLSDTSSKACSTLELHISTAISNDVIDQLTITPPASASAGADVTCAQHASSSSRARCCQQFSLEISVPSRCDSLPLRRVMTDAPTDRSRRLIQWHFAQAIAHRCEERRRLLSPVVPRRVCASPWLPSVSVALSTCTFTAQGASSQRKRLDSRALHLIGCPWSSRTGCRPLVPDLGSIDRNTVSLQRACCHRLLTTF